MFHTWITRKIGGMEAGAEASAFDGARPIKGDAIIGMNTGATTVNEFLEDVFFPFVQAIISLNSGTSYYETGSEQNISLSGSISANDETIFSDAKIYVVQDAEEIAFASQAGAFNVNDSNVVADCDYIAKVTVGGNGTQHPISSETKRIRFLLPFLYGSSAEQLTGDNLYTSLTKLIQTKANKTVNFNASNSYFYFAYPVSYGVLTAIKDQNGFDVTASFQVADTIITSLQGGLSSTFKVYRTINTTSINGNFTFNF